MRKIFALLIAMVMVLGMSTMVFAAGTGSITITPPDLQGTLHIPEHQLLVD